MKGSMYTPVLQTLQHFLLQPNVHDFSISNLYEIKSIDHNAFRTNLGFGENSAPHLVCGYLQNHNT